MACTHQDSYVDGNGWGNCRSCGHQWPVNPDKVD